MRDNWNQYGGRSYEPQQDVFVFYQWNWAEWFKKWCFGKNRTRWRCTGMKCVFLEYLLNSNHLTSRLVKRPWWWNMSKINLMKTIFKHWVSLNYFIVNFNTSSTKFICIYLGVNFMEKTIILRNTEITFSIWDLGGQREFLSMLPLVCNDAVTIFFMFDLSRKSTLMSIKEWYRQARGLNRVRSS